MAATQTSVEPTKAEEDGKRLKIGRAVIWFGLIAPLAVSESRPASEIAADPVTLTTLFRGLTPALCLLVAALLLRPRARVESIPEGLAVAFIGVATVSTLWSVAPLATVFKAGALAASYGLVLLLVRTCRSLDDAVADVVMVAQGLVLTALVGAVLVPEQAFPDYYTWGGPVRLFGVLPEVHPVPLGMLAVVGLLGGIAGVGRWRCQRHLGGRVVIFTACLLALGLTYTRSAWITAPVAVLVYVTLRGRTRAAIGLAMAVLVALLFLISPENGSTVPEWLTRGEGIEGLASIGWRLPMWEVAIDVWSKRPLTGYGYYAGHRYGPYPAALSKLRGSDVSEYAYIDSAYIEAAMDLGLLGLVPLVSLVIIGTYLVLRRVRRYRNTSVVAVPILAVLIVDSALSYSLQVPSYQGQLLLLILLASGLRSDGKRPTSVRSEGGRS